MIAVLRGKSGLGSKIPVLGGIPVSDGKFQALLCDEYPGRFRHRQGVVLQLSDECILYISRVYVRTTLTNRKVKLTKTKCYRFEKIL
jgi:hypothetical protein